MAEATGPLSMRFHRSVYPPEAVRAAAERFAPAVGSVSVEERDADSVVTLDGVPERVRGRILDELGNHALFEAMLARRGRA